jgi:hypothetical protein
MVVRRSKHFLVRQCACRVLYVAIVLFSIRCSLASTMPIDSVSPREPTALVPFYCMFRDWRCAALALLSRIHALHDRLPTSGCQCAHTSVSLTASSCATCHCSATFRCALSNRAAASATAPSRTGREDTSTIRVAFTRVSFPAC